MSNRLQGKVALVGDEGKTDENVLEGGLVENNCHGIYGFLAGYAGARLR
jgi:hypothetical protein